MMGSMHPLFREQIRRALVAYKWRWICSFAALQVLPFVEIGLILMIYLMVDNSQRVAVSGWFDRHGGFGLFPTPIDVTTLLTTAFIAALAALAVQMTLKFTAQMTLARLRIRVTIDDSQSLLDRYFFSKTDTVRRIGQERITSSIINDCGVLGDSIKQWLEIAAATFALVIYIGAAAFLSWEMLAVAAVIYAVPLYLNRRTYNQMQKIAGLKIKAQEEVLGFFTDILDGFRRTKIDALENDLRDRSADVLFRNQEWRLRKRLAETRFGVILDGLSLFGVLVLIFGGVVMLGIALSKLLLLFVVFNRMKGYVTAITRAYLNVRSQRPQLRRYVDLMELLEPAFPSDAAPAEVPEPIRSIGMRGVSYCYDADQPVLRELNFTARAGDRILITGPSGQGKSTFLEVLCGLLPPDAGEVRVNDGTLDSDLFHRVRAGIAYVAPDLYLFRGTLRVNLTLGARAGPDDIARAVKLAGLEELVAALPDGLDSSIGVDGNELSLGQRQRVILARIYLKHPSLVLLDEATANLDPKLERDLIDRLQSFVDPDAIIVMIAHKAPPNYRYNCCFTMENGRLIEQPANLVAQAGE